MNKGRRIGNTTPIHERKQPNFPSKPIAKSPTPRPVGLKPSTPSIPTTSNGVCNSRTFTLRIQKKEEEGKQRYSSSKEKRLINKIATLNKEKNEICLNFKRHENLLKKEIESTKSNNQTLRQVMQKIIPLINDKISSEMKAQIQESLKESITIEQSTQCDLSLSEEKSEVNSEAKKIREEREQLMIYTKFVVRNKDKLKDCNAVPNFIKSLYISNLL